MSAARDPTSRLRAGLNPLLTTSLGVYHNPNTPLSAVSMSSHNALSATSHTSASAIQPYNPQEWVGSPAAGPGERNSQMFTSEPQASPLPPPPYSPPRSQRPVSIVYESSLANISATRAPAPPVQRPSPETPVNSSFAPPPATSRRHGSRERRFGLPTFGRRREADQVTTPSDAHSSTPVIQAPTAITSSARHSPAALTLQIPPQRPAQQLSDPTSPGVPPAARRAASTGALDGTPTSARSRSASQARWEPGMPIPPPPPGPPPTGTRSQSVSRTSSGSESVKSPPTRRPPPAGVASLGPVPPTPANWNENVSKAGEPSPSRPSFEESSADTESSGDIAVPAASPPGSATGLNRQGAVRGEKTLRERRNESRTRGGVRGSIDGSLNDARLSNIVIPTAGSSRRLTIGRPTPHSAPTGREAGETASPESRNTTPRPLGSAQAGGSHPGTPTPPFSPHPLKSHPIGIDGTVLFIPKALPTPPPHSNPAASSQTRVAASDTPVPPPRSPSRTITREAVIKQSADQFCAGTIERFQAFAQKEAAVSTDAERVKLFADFVVSESRIRRERYSSAIGAMGSEIFDLSRDLFRPMAARRESTTSQASGVEFTPQSSEPSRSHRGSIGSVSRETPHVSGSSSAPASANLPMSPTGPPNGWQQREEFMPSLSPILSMSVGDNLDGRSSRGRPASRWWEADSTGEAVGRLERSKRESKYMGVPKEAREALQWIDTPRSVPSSSQRDSSNEYPPEKVGWHEPEQSATPQPQHPSRASLLPGMSSPNTPNLYQLDVSRLVTLPPPYPRHHPALNNSHPELASMRNAVRAISDLAEVDAVKQQFLHDSEATRRQAAEASKQRSQALRRNLQEEIAAGNMSYAEAAAIEADSQETEKTRLKALEKTEFERFQAVVVGPLNHLLETRIAKSTALFDELRGRLFVETRQPSPNMAQEEGDEQPELLEKLTLLKWIFEAREALHRAIYDLLTDRNDRYRDMVLTPYRLAGNDEKVAGAQAFFAEDAAKRAVTFGADVLRRTKEFRDVVEENVVRGVELTLSAFWDIAPPLKRLLDKIPLDLHNFGIVVPSSEFAETPSYHSHPLQYLFSLLLHAEKSTYQFIESQTNLLCLLHQVEESVATARVQAREGSRADDEQERARLTADLKEKVRVVQDQWQCALGEAIRGVKERTGEWLLQTGGWDESLEEGGVGSV